MYSSKSGQQFAQRRPHLWSGLVLSGLLLVPATGCGLLPRSDAQTGPPGRGQEDDGPVAVETAIAQSGSVEAALEYTGTTRPVQEAIVRSQVDGQLRSLTVDVGDAVGAGEVVAQVDDTLLQVAVNEAKAELTSRQSEVAQAEAEVSDVQTNYEEAKVQLQQAQTDANRLRQLANAGAISFQEAEQAELTRDLAQQALRSAEQQIRTRQQAVNAAQGRVEAQRAVVAQEQEQLSYTAVQAPFSGVVLAKNVDAGDYVQTGTDILRIGDLNTLEVTVQLSELDLSRVRPGQSVQVRFDALPDQTFTGQVTRIAPVADTASRQLPVEITLPNPSGRIGSGLLARVQFMPPGTAQVVVPQEAVQDIDGQPQIFVVSEGESGATVSSRPVRLGDRANNQIEILSGLEPNETYVLTSDRPLADGQAVRLSILSETRPN